MRFRITLIAGLFLWSGGCSGFIQHLGQDITPLKTREQVRQEFGTPTTSGTTVEGEAYDDFKTRRKISDADPVAGIRFAMTFGLAEFIDFPEVLLANGLWLVVGQTLRFKYDADGNVTHYPLLRDAMLQHAGPPVTLAQKAPIPSAESEGKPLQPTLP